METWIAVLISVYFTFNVCMLLFVKLMDGWPKIKEFLAILLFGLIMTLAAIVQENWE